MAATTNLATLMSGRFDEKDIPNLTGRTAIVTGGSAGIGYWDALALAHHGAKVIIISSQEEKLSDAASEMNNALKQESKNGTVEFEQLDLGDLKAVDKLSKKLAKDLDRLDILIANGGIGQGDYGKTKDGYPNHMAVNIFSHYLMIQRLLPLMEKTATEAKNAPANSVRIVFQSSEMHRLAPGGSKFKDLAEVDEPDRDPAKLYGRSKLAMVLLAKEIAKRKVSPGASAVLLLSVHPGTVDTDLQEAWAQSYGLVGAVMNKLTRFTGKSAQEGAEASLWAATSTKIGGDYQGKYFSEPNGKPDTESSDGMDDEAAANLYELCAKSVKDVIGEDVR